MNVIVGTGRLGTVLVKMIKKENVGVYGRNQQTINELTKNDKVTELKKEDLVRAKRVFLCLPKESYGDFFQEHDKWLSNNVELYHFATALTEEVVRSYTNKKTVIPCKLVGHAKQMREDNQGMFVLPEHCYHFRDELQQVFPSITIALASEQQALLANKITTEYVLQMMTSLESRLEGEGVPSELCKQSLSQTVRGIAKAYVEGDLGGFAKQVIDEQRRKDNET